MTSIYHIVSYAIKMNLVAEPKGLDKAANKKLIKFFM